tara:strand:- start:971 stop:1306 length:336 start_codon:yes stop_codon:yes gene_type:complete
MPLIRLVTSSVHYDEKNLIKIISSEFSTLLKKPEKYIMVTIENNDNMIFDASFEPSAYLEIKSIGLTDRPYLVKNACQLIEKYTDITSNRIYINLQDVKASDWGYNNSTFG